MPSDERERDVDDAAVAHRDDALARDTRPTISSTRRRDAGT